MRAAFALVALLSITPVFAEVPQVYHLEVEGSELVAIGTALNELPKRIADPLIAKLQTQVNAQNEAAKKAAEEAAEAKTEPKPDDVKP